jgi:2-methylisocitrate lyase-like PEP mutase family enzyme
MTTAKASDDLEGMRPASRLRQLLAQEGGLVTMGCHDALGALLTQQAGFPLAHMTGYGVAVSLLGRPDLAELTMTEVTVQASRIAEAIEIPLICDSDTGYGGPLNVQRTVREFEKAGVAGIHIEDQIEPKKCAGMGPPPVTDLQTALTKLRAAMAARQDKDFVIIARTDCKATLGLEAAIDRAKAFAEAGADMVYVELMFTRAEVETVARELEGIPKLIDVFEHPDFALIPADELIEMGYNIISFPMTATLACARAMQEVYAAVKQANDRAAAVDRIMDIHSLEDILGLKRLKRIAAGLEDGPE